MIFTYQPIELNSTFIVTKRLVSDPFYGQIFFLRKKETVNQSIDELIRVSVMWLAVSRDLNFGSSQCFGYSRQCLIVNRWWHSSTFPFRIFDFLWKFFAGRSPRTVTKFSFYISINWFLEQANQERPFNFVRLAQPIGKSLSNRLSSALAAASSLHHRWPMVAAEIRWYHDVMRFFWKTRNTLEK